MVSWLEMLSFKVLLLDAKQYDNYMLKNPVDISDKNILVNNLLSNPRTFTSQNFRKIKSFKIKIFKKLLHNFNEFSSP